MNNGLQLHDRAEKKRKDDPAAACALYREAIGAYTAAEALLPEGQNSVELHFNMGVAHTGLANAVKEMETRNWKEQYIEALCKATVCYSNVLEEDGNHVEATNNWGTALHSLSEVRERPEALLLLQEASAKLDHVCSLAPADFEACNNHADALAAWAALLAYDDAGNLVCGADSEARWAAAYDRFAASMPLMTYDFDRVNCLCNWSTALSKHAELRQDLGDKQTAYSLYISAADKLKQSCQLSHSDPDGFVALAEAQKSAAENAPVEVQEEGLQHVCASYREALRILASHSEALAGLGETMLDLGRLMLSQGRLDEAHSTLTGAGELLFQYLSAKGADETALHNMACVCALLGRLDECQQYLDRCGRVQMTQGNDMNAWCAEVSSDADLANARALPWFQDLLVAARAGFGVLQ